MKTAVSQALATMGLGQRTLRRLKENRTFVIGADGTQDSLMGELLRCLRMDMEFGCHLTD